MTISGRSSERKVQPSAIEEEQMRLLAMLFTLAAGVGATVLPASGEEATGVDVSLQSLKRDLLSEKIKRVRVLFVPYEVATRVRLTPELLRTSAEFARVLEMDEAMRGRLLAAIEKTRVTPLDSPPDLRWGAIFLDSQEVQLHSIYLNGKILLGTGRQGIIDGNRVKLNDALVEWFEAAFGDPTRTPTR
jgi:hypothetical protein